MKHAGNTSDYIEEINQDVMRAYYELLQSSENIVLQELTQKLVNMSSRRFWVSEERVAIVCAKMMKGDKLRNMRPTTRKMYKEIYKRVLVYKKKYPEMSLAEIAFHVVRQPAPMFYLTPGSAKVIIQRTKKKVFEQRMKRLKHMFNPIK